MKTYLGICTDGCSPACFRYADRPTLDVLVPVGACKELRAAVPTVTKVNSVSILRGGWQTKRDITRNHYCDRRTHRNRCMKTAGFPGRWTVVEQVHPAGWRSAWLTVEERFATCWKPLHPSASPRRSHCTGLGTAWVHHQRSSMRRSTAGTCKHSVK